MLEDLLLIKHKNLLKLKKYLNYSLTSSGFFLFGFFIGFSVNFIFLILAAIIFTPFMIYTLHQEDKKGWIFFFFLIVILPIVLILALTFFIKAFTPLLMLGLLFPYFYFFLLRFEVNGWVRELNNKLDYQKEKEARDLEMKTFMKSFE